MVGVRKTEFVGINYPLMGSAISTNGRTHTSHQRYVDLAALNINEKLYILGSFSLA